jgi:RimJ/RimL family protein N-acetyltransferase
LAILNTARMHLEPITLQHLDGLCSTNSHIEVMRYISGQPETRNETEASIAIIQRCWSAWDTGWWAFIEPANGRVAGAGCIQYAHREAELPAKFESVRSNPLEIGWRLHPDFWHQGFASEAAARMATFAFESLAAPEIIAMRHPDNAASAGVMDRLGMLYRGQEVWYGEVCPTYVLSRED